MSPYGTYDMAGNAKEWCWNATGNKRYILGGAWNEPSYEGLLSSAILRRRLQRTPQTGHLVAASRSGGP